jgi:hypothetical protein
MTEHETHCPFLNRPDERCSGYFHIDHLEHAFAHCFDSYEACPVYAERLAERQVRRKVDAVRGIAASGVSYGGEVQSKAAARPLVQVTISKRFVQAFRRTKASAEPAGYPQHAAAVEAFSAVSGI